MLDNTYGPHKQAIQFFKYITRNDETAGYGALNYTTNNTKGFSFFMLMKDRLE